MVGIHQIYAIQKYKGIGMHTAQKIIQQNYIHRFAKMGDLDEEKFNALKTSIQQFLEAEKEKNLKAIKNKLRYDTAYKKAFEWKY